MSDAQKAPAPSAETERAVSWASMRVLAYENVEVMRPLVEALHAQCGDGEWVIYRRPFRWLRYEGDFHNGHVMSNCYEMFSLESVLEMTGLEARYSFEHAAIVGRLVARSLKGEG